MSGRVRLAITQGKLQGQEFVFDEHDTFIFGRLEDCHACLPGDTLISRHHFILEANPPDARLRDLGSKNGTYVNGQKVGGRERHETPEEGARRQYPEVDLHDGDEIKAGETVLQVSVELPVECVECGTPIPEEGREKYVLVGRTYLCGACRARLAAKETGTALNAGVSAEPTRLATGRPEPPRCQRCGKDASVEIGPGRHGDYVCQACRQGAEADPGALLMDLLNRGQAAGQPALNLPDYAIEKELGRGGMGVVYLARDRQSGVRAALKVMLSQVAVDEHSRQVFMREVETTRSLRHKNIVEFLAHGSAGGLFYFLLEYCEGGSVGGLMERRGGRLALKEAGPIMLQTLAGLAFLHDRDFVHRDIKPGNILLTGQERAWTVKVADMGLAKNFARAGFSGMTATGTFGGSLPFMAREQLTVFKYYQPVSDVWAVGATFYNMLTHEYPRDFSRVQDPMEVILSGDIVPIRRRAASIPKRVAEVIDRALATQTSDRYQNAGEMWQAMEKAL